MGAISKPPVGGGTDGGVFQVSLDTLTRYVPTAPDTTVYLNTAPSTDQAAVGGRLDQLVSAYPRCACRARPTTAARSASRSTPCST